MAKIERIFARSEGIVEAETGALWDVLTDWGSMEWWGNELERDGMEVGKFYLEGEKGTLPRTKVLERSNAEGAGLPLVNRETLFLEDPVAHRLYYTATDGFIAGVRNYIATWALDELPGGRTRMLLSSTFDVVEPADAAMIKDTVESVYDLIVKGLNGYFAKGLHLAPAHG
ncbi:SRPBCC family protein [Rhizorhabdus argentea]|uniref:SRPBCC family protein n=1 Tax=Rhizorhabdus argentea TaxID=1387174 RepID=UPI0030EDFB6F